MYRFQSFGFTSVLYSITDRYSNTTTLTEVQIAPLVMRITAITDPIGRTLALSYDSRFHVTSVTDPAGRTVKYTYNPTGTLATVTDPAGGVTTYGYDGQNRITSMTDARGVVMFVNSYDANGRVSQQVLPDGGVVQFSYLLANPLAATSPVISTTITDALGHQTIYRFNVQEFVTGVTDPRGQTKTFVRDPGTNQLLQVTGTAQCPVCGPQGRGDVSYTYDGQGNRMTITDALGNTTHFGYDPVFSQVTSIADALNHTRTFSYDNLGNLQTLTDENGHATTYTHDSYGQPLSVTDPMGNKMSITYDAAENPVAIADPLGNVITRRFDSLSRPITITSPLGLETVNHYDLLDRTISKLDGQGHAIHFAYDAVGNLVKLADQRNQNTTFTYDGLNRLTSTTNPLGKTVTYTYDLDGNLTQFTDRKGQVSTFQYDALDRLTSESYQDGSTVAYIYDPYSRPLSVKDSSGGVFTYSYDAAGRMITENEPNGTVDYTRDALGRVATRQVVGQTAVTYAYDAAGNLSGAAMPGASVSYTYDDRNLPTQVTRSNGVNSALTLDGMGQVISLVHSKGGTARNSQAYSYDPDGGRFAVTNDISQPLTTAAITAAVDAANELLTNGQTLYTYDDNGNRLTETNPNGNYRYAWDSRNRLTSLTDGSGNRTSFRYDAGRNLIEIDRTSGGAQKFVLDNLTNISSLTDASGLPVSVLTGTSIDAHLASIDSAGNATFGIGDPLGNTIAATDANGNITATLKYEPFGQTTGTSPASYPFTYTGRIPVGGNILYHRNRFYDTGTGRFLSEDPIGFAGGDTNLYQYAGADPVNGRDPTGLENESGVGTVFGGGAGAFAGLGAEFGEELVKLDNCLCQEFYFIGPGVGFGGFGGSFEVGGARNVFDPSDYAGGFVTMSAGAGYGASASIGTPCFPGLGCQTNSQGEIAPSAAITQGLVIGEGVSFTLRWYWADGPPFPCAQ